MSRLLFLCVVGIITILSCVDNVDAQRFRNRNNSNCGCQPNSQQSYQPYRANYQRRYQANSQPGFGAYGVRRNYVAARRVPVYYQQNAMLRYQPVQQIQLSQQAQPRPMVQYSVAQGCWVPAPNPYGRTQMQAGNFSIDPEIATEPSEVRPATFEAPMELSGRPQAAPESVQPVDPVPATDPAASSVLDNGN